VSNPFAVTATCDIFWDPTHAVPDMSGVPCTLVAAWDDGQYHGTRNMPTLMYTHMMHLEPTIDIRDAYIGAMAAAAKIPYLMIPNYTDTVATKFNISFVTRVNIGQRADHKVAYLNRSPVPAWPTKYL
jgi:hypothetical protein